MSNEKPSMAWLIIRSILFGLLGLVVTPILTAILVLGLAYTFDSRCGTPGDSGGCEMGAFSVALAMALPGFAIGFFASLIPGLRRRNRAGIGG